MTKEEALEGQRALRIINEWLMDRENKMKAPNKVHIAPMRSKGYVGIAWAEEHGEGYVEYIRKDAILEWAKEMKEQVGLGLNAYDMGEENGKAEILNALIDKLNEL